MGSRDAEAGAEIVEEGDFELLAGLGEAEHDVAGLTPLIADGPAGDFSFGDEAADVVFRGVGMERDFGAFEDAHQSVFEAQQTAQQAVERGISGFGAIEDSLELRAQDFGSLGAGSELVVLQLAIEPPDHSPRDLDGLALNLVGGDQLVDESFGVDPALRVHADAELAGAVRNNDEIAEPALLLKRAPQRALAGHAHGIGRDRQLGHAQLAQAPHPILIGGEDPHRAVRELVEGGLGKVVVSHVDKRGFIDDVAGRPAQEVAQKRSRDLLGPVRNTAKRSEPM